MHGGVIQSPSHRIEVPLLTVAGERKCVLVPATMDQHVVILGNYCFAPWGHGIQNIEFPFFFLTCCFCCFACFSLSLSLSVLEAVEQWKEIGSNSGNNWMHSCLFPLL